MHHSAPRWLLKLCVAALCLLLAGTSFAADGPMPAAALSTQSQQVTPTVLLAGTLRPDAAQALAGSDTVVIDLRGPKEGAVVEGRQMAAAGVNWINIPQGAETPSRADVNLLGDILNAQSGHQIVLHCSSGHRAGKLWAALRMEQGVPVDDALRQVSGVVTRPEVISAIRAYVPQRPTRNSE